MAIAGFEFEQSAPDVLADRILDTTQSLDNTLQVAVTTFVEIPMAVISAFFPSS